MARSPQQERPMLAADYFAQQKPGRGNKYGAQRCWSAICERTFDSKAERKRGEDLWMQQKAGAISCLKFQVTWALSNHPKVTYAADFVYVTEDNRRVVVEDCKGLLTRETRVKLAWLHEKFGVIVRLVDADGNERDWLGKHKGKGA